MGKRRRLPAHRSNRDERDANGNGRHDGGQDAYKGCDGRNNAVTGIPQYRDCFVH